jgi:peptidoglycan/LPS O-acetylase OafA/YrhL
LKCGYHLLEKGEIARGEIMDYSQHVSTGVDFNSFLDGRDKALAERRLEYIDVLRGCAILMVIAVHTSANFSLPPWLAKITVQGARGVQLFFVVSALTLCMSWFGRHATITDFYLRRIFRIAPLFWLAILFYLGLNGWGESGIRRALASALFVHGLWPDTIISVVPGGWSIADEVIFYALFPFLVPRLITCNWRNFIVVTILAIVGGAQISRIFGALQPNFPETMQNGGDLFFSLWFPRQLPCFLFGIALFRFGVVDHRKIGTLIAGALLALSILLFIAMSWLDGVKYALPLGLQTTAGLIFSVSAFALANLAPSPFSVINHVMIWTGKVSYSAYFVHFAVIRFISPQEFFGVPILDFAAYFLLVTAISLTIASATYAAIEQPAIRLGSRVINRRVARQNARSPVSTKYV